MKRIPRIGYTALLIGQLLWLLAACDSSSTKVSPDTTQPSATIQFPTPNALTESDTIRVRGTTSGFDSGVDSVVVNSVPATSDDGFAHWSAEVPLVYGKNPITVDVRDRAGNRNSLAAQAQVTYQPNILQNPNAIALDSVNNRALVVDSGLKALLEVNLNNGERTVISDATIGGGDKAFSSPNAIALDSIHNRALVVDSGLKALLDVNLSTGERRVISDNDTENGGPAFNFPIAIALDNDNKRALVIDNENSPALLAVDLNTGERRVISDNDTKGSGQTFATPTAITLDSDNNRALVLDAFLNVVLAVDLADNNNEGKRTVISDTTPKDGETTLSKSVAITLDRDNMRILVLDAGLDALLALDRDKKLTIISDATTGSGDKGFSSATALALDSDNKRALVQTRQGLLAVDLNTGQRTVISETSIGGGDKAFSSPQAIALDRDNTRALVVDANLQALFAVDLNTGERRVISDNDTKNGGPTFIAPYAMALDTDNNRALVVDKSLKALLKVDLSTGEREVVSDNDTKGSAPGLSYPSAIALGRNNKEALVLDDGLNALLAVNLDTGERSLISDSTDDYGDQMFISTPVAIAFDRDTKQALMLDNGLKALLAVDLGTGDRGVISDNSTDFSGQKFISPIAIALDSNNNQALVLDYSLYALLAVNLKTGARTVISDASTGGGDNAFYNPTAIALDSVNNRALVLNDGSNALLAVDLTNGDRVYVSK
ncbi:hypothetical protein ABMA57_09000 [Saccharospirillum sp. HFRX-1]|uniref:hypothetical protein n=1 Tax=unclassified Saccharospirillum TaxID=2633430 RepID=UPI00371DA722